MNKITTAATLLVAFAFAQDVPVPEKYKGDIDTGDPGAFIVDGRSTDVRGNDPGFREMKPDNTPIGQANLQLPSGTTKPRTYSFKIVHGYLWEKKPGSATDEYVAHLDTNPCCIMDLNEVLYIDRDPDIRFRAWETSRIHLKRGGYLRIDGRADGADGHIRRFNEALGSVMYFGETKSRD